MRGASVPENVLYYTKIQCVNEKFSSKLHKGICETTFKKHYTNHKKSYKAEENINDENLYTKY